MIGRKKEIQELNSIYCSGKAELVAIYGRRRIGKTYLVDETFKGRITFRHAGLSPMEIEKKGMLKAQLEHFYYSLLLQGMKKEKKPDSWLEAFFMLEKFLEEKNAELVAAAPKGRRNDEEEDKIRFVQAEIAMIPQNRITLPEDKVATFEKMIDALEDLDDVQDVYHNVELPDEE